MKISYNWLREIADIKESAKEIADLLTGCGLEVEGIEKFESIKGGLKGIVVGEVKTCIRHPNADKLSLTTVNIGGETDLQIVCGAPNVAAGQKVLVAPVGSMVNPVKGEPFEIKKAKIRGETSEGMICAEDELSLGESHSGILVLPLAYENGKPATDYFKVYTDEVFEIGLTANRGDAASHLGVARDLKALRGCGLKQLPMVRLPHVGSMAGPVSVAIEDSESCPRYSGAFISGIEVKDSPEWLKTKLKSIGLNPLNNVVDATNFVMHELGQPLHAFDADKIAGNKIMVKKAVKGSKFITLDKIERELTGNECMICDSEKPLAIAGVFGGLDSGITQTTQNIFIESAFFSPSSIRKTAKHHGLMTDASYRYERGTDPNVTVTALERVIHILLEIGGGTLSPTALDVYPSVIENSIVEFSLTKFYQLIGQEIPGDEVKRILEALEIKILNEKETDLRLSIPPYRVDVKRAADIAEEVLRIYGLNKIEIPVQLKSTLTRYPDEDVYMLRDKLAVYLSNVGFYEMVGNSLTKSAYYGEEELKHAVKIINPLSNDLDIMRMSMIYNGLEMIQYNGNRKSPDIKSYEFGFTYTSVDGKYKEVPHLSVFITGKKKQESWKEPQQNTGYFGIKTVLENVFTQAGIRGIEYSYPDQSPFLDHLSHIVYKGRVVAQFGSVKATVLKPFDIEQEVFYADIYLEELKDARKNSKFEGISISSFPSVRRDLALLLDREIQYGDLKASAFKAEPNLIKEINVFDVYEGDKVPPGKKSYAMSFILQDETKTLTDSEIEGVMNKLIRKFEKEFSAKLRS